MDKTSRLAFQRAKLARLPREYPSILVAYAPSLPPITILTNVLNRVNASIARGTLADTICLSLLEGFSQKVDALLGMGFPSPLPCSIECCPLDGLKPIFTPPFNSGVYGRKQGWTLFPHKADTSNRPVRKLILYKRGI